MLEIWLAELRASRLWAAICEIASGRDLARALSRAHRWFFEES